MSPFSTFGVLACLFLFAALPFPVFGDDLAAFVFLSNTTCPQLWTPNVDPCLSPFQGVTCGVVNNETRVVEIDVPQICAGPLVSQIGDLDALRVLRLTKNTAQFPTEIGLLANLTEFVIGDGEPGWPNLVIHTEIGNLVSLEILEITTMQLVAGIPTEIGQLGTLKSLEIDQVGFGGSPIPTQIGNLTALESLRLVLLDFTGGLPTEIGALSLLKSMDLNTLNLTGFGLPTQVGSLGNLETLKIINVEFDNTIPTEIGNLDSLTNLFLDGLDLNGPLPTEFGGMSSLRIADLINLDFAGGSLPTEIGLLANLEILYMSTFTSLVSTIPTEFGSLSSLVILDILDVPVNGTVPTEFGLLSSLEQVFLESLPTLEGTLPADIFGGNLIRLHARQVGFAVDLPASLPVPTNLTDLWIQDATAVNGLPSNIGVASKMTRIQVQASGLVGTIPTSIGDLALLTELHLNANQLTGTVPTEMANLASLQGLYLGGNTLEGEFPAGILALPQLTELYLSGGNTFCPKVNYSQINENDYDPQEPYTCGCVDGTTGDECQYQVPLGFVASNLTFYNLTDGPCTGAENQTCQEGFACSDGICLSLSPECYEWGQLVGGGDHCACYSGTEPYTNNLGDEVCLDAAQNCTGLLYPDDIDLVHPVKVYLGTVGDLTPATLTTVSENHFYLGLYHPVVNGRVVHEIYLNSYVLETDAVGSLGAAETELCNYPHNMTTWPKSVEAAGYLSGTTTCTDLYRAVISIQDLVSGCSATYRNISNYQVIDGVATVLYTDYVEFLEGQENFFRSVRNDFYYTISLPTTATASVTLLALAEERIALALLLASYVYDTDTLTVQFRAATYWPYNITQVAMDDDLDTPINGTLVSATVDPAGLACQDLEFAPCRTHVTFTFANLRDLGHCDPTGAYTFYLTLDCRDDFSPCPTSLPVQVPVTFNMEMNDICGEISFEGTLLADLDSYSDAAYLAPQTTFAIDDRIYFEATLEGDAVIQVASLTAFEVRDPQTNLFPVYPAGNPDLETLLDMQIISSGAADSVRFSLVLDDAVGSPFADLEGTESFLFTAYLVVYYDVGLGRKRSTEVKEMVIKKMMQVSPREDPPTDAPTDAPTETATDAPTDAPTETATDAPTVEATDAPTEAPTATTGQGGNTGRIPNGWYAAIFSVLGAILLLSCLLVMLRNYGSS